jgi:hypothetical protein
MLSIRSLALVSLSALSIFGASVQAQQSFAPGPQTPFWSFNPYFPQAQMWAAPMPMQPMRQLMPQPIPQPIPFPTPFWLWPMVPQIPAPSPSPPVRESAATTATPDSAQVMQIPSPDLSPAASDAPQTSADAATPSTPEVPLSATAEVTPAPELDAPYDTATDSPPAGAAAVDPGLPTSPEAPATPTDPASLAPPVAVPEAEPVTTADQIDNPVVKARTAKKKSTRKIRKLCWKDGRLDVCP